MAKTDAAADCATNLNLPVFYTGKQQTDKTEGFHRVNDLKGHYVKRKAASRQVYLVIGYCRLNRAWQLDDANDISTSVYVKPGTLLYAGFTY
jgi:hypothetical protein